MITKGEKVVSLETGENGYAAVVPEGRFAKVIDPNNQKRNIKHVRVRVARKQERLYRTLTIEERGFIFSILPYLEWETNIVSGNGIIEEKGKPLTFIQIEQIMGISKNTRKKLVDSLVSKKVIGFLMVRGKKAAIVVNPEYVLKGRKPSDALKKTFDYELNVLEDNEDEELD